MVKSIESALPFIAFQFILLAELRFVDRCRFYIYKNEDTLSLCVCTRVCAHVCVCESNLFILFLLCFCEMELACVNYFSFDSGNWTYTHTIRRPEINKESPELRMQISAREYQVWL